MAEHGTKIAFDKTETCYKLARGLMHPLGYWNEVEHYHVGINLDGIQAPSGGTGIAGNVLAKHGESLAQVAATNRRGHCVRVVRRSELSFAILQAKTLGTYDQFGFWEVRDIGGQVPVATSTVLEDSFPARDNSRIYDFAFFDFGADVPYNHATRSVEWDDWLLLVFDGDVEYEYPGGDPVPGSKNYDFFPAKSIFKRNHQWYRRSFRIEAVGDRFVFSSPSTFEKTTSTVNDYVQQSFWKNTYTSINFSEAKGSLTATNYGSVGYPTFPMPWDGYPATEGKDYFVGFLPANGFSQPSIATEYLGGDFALPESGFTAFPGTPYSGPQTGTVTVASGTYPVGVVFSQLPSDTSHSILRPAACQTIAEFSQGWSFRGECGYKLTPVGKLQDAPRRAVMPSGLQLDLTYQSSGGSQTTQTTLLRRLTIEDIDDYQQVFLSPGTTVVFSPGGSLTTNGYEVWFGITGTGGLVTFAPGDKLYGKVGGVWCGTSKLQVFHDNPNNGGNFENVVTTISDPVVGSVSNPHEVMRTVSLTPFRAEMLACGPRERVIDGNFTASLGYFQNSVSAVITPGTAPALPTVRPNVVTITSGFSVGKFLPATIDGNERKIVLASNTGTFRTADGGHTISVSLPGDTTARWLGTNVAGTKLAYSLTNSLSFTSPAVSKITLEVGGTYPPAPVAEFSASSVSVDVGDAVSFADLSTGSPTTWGYDFGDGNTSTSKSPTHSWSEPGKYTVSLTVSNSTWFDTETKPDYITVNTDPPTADFSAWPTSGAAPLEVSFFDSSSPFITGWAWKLGDGGSSTSQNPTHTYTTEGKFAVELTATNFNGSDTEVKTDYIDVYVPPVADFTAATTSGAAPLTITFTNTSSHRPVDHFWDFGDGFGFSTDVNPTYEYTSAGTYTVSLTVTNPAGSDSKTRIDYITVT